MAEGQAAAAHSQRAGRYITQPTGYRAFEPAPLPPQPALELDGELQRLLSSADRALGRLDGSVLTLPNPDLFVFMYVRKEAVLSSQIEGTQSSLQDLLSAEAKMFDEALPSDVDEVVNYVRAMNHGLARLAELPVSVRLIREIHAELMQGVRGGRLQPGRAALAARTGSARPAARWPLRRSCRRRITKCHEALGDLENFLHRDGRPAAAGEDRAGACAVRDHPPVPRRQRARRAAADHVPADRARRAAQAGAVPVALLQADTGRSTTITCSRCDEGRLGSLALVLPARRGRGRRRGGGDSPAHLQLREEHRGAITTHLGRAAGNGHKVLESLFDRPIVTVNDVRSMTGTPSPRPTAWCRVWSSLRFSGDDRLRAKSALPLCAVHRAVQRHRDSAIRGCASKPTPCAPPQR